MYRQWVNLPPDQLYATIGVSRSSCMLDVEWPTPDRGDIDIKNVGVLRCTLHFSGPHSSLLFWCTCVPHFSFSVYCFFLSVYVCTTLFFHFRFIAFFSVYLCTTHFLFTSGLLIFFLSVYVCTTVFFSLPVYFACSAMAENPYWLFIACLKKHFLHLKFCLICVCLCVCVCV